MYQFFWNIVMFIIAISTLIIIHELGHFLAARFYGVVVECFSIGFGPIIWEKYDKLGTKYVISIIPFGGYVKMLDNRINNMPYENICKTFNHKAIWKRVIIIFSGPFFNFLFAFFSYWFLFIIGIPGYRPIINDIIPGSIISKFEILPGMEFKSINDVMTPDWDSVRLQLINTIGNKEIRISLSPYNSYNIERKIITLKNFSFDLNEQDPVIALGIIPLFPRVEPIIKKIKLGSAAMKSGLKVGDKIIKIDNQQVNSWNMFVKKIKDNPSQPLNLIVERQKNFLMIVLVPDEKIVKKDKIEGFSGITPEIIPLSEEYKIIHKYSFLTALFKSCEKIWYLIRTTVNMLGKFIIGNIKLTNLNGPVSIAYGAGISAKQGIIHYLIFLSLISVNLGIINLFPFPVLDGGHIIFLIIEKLIGRPISERIQNFSYLFGSILLTILMIITIFNDFSIRW